MSETRYEVARHEMVERQLRGRGISDERVLAAMAEVPRHVFVEHNGARDAYGDHPLPIGFGQTITQPYMVALMLEQARLSAEHRVLDIGAGSGYQTALLSRLCAEVVAVELLEPLAMRARQRLDELGCENVLLEHADGTLGWPARAPYDAVLVAAGAPAMPEPLAQQLADGGRLVIPVGDRFVQTLTLYVREGDQLRCHQGTACRFVDLKGEHGWSS